jgi:gliding motility-associated lipoprotein GldH
MRKAVFVLILILLAISCDNDIFFHEKYTFDDFIWTKDKKVIFRPEISKEFAGKKLHAIINIRYISGFPYKYLNFSLIITHRNGIQTSKEVSIQVLNDNKEYQGSGMGDIWDLDYELTDPMIFNEPGSYEIEFKPILDNQAYNFINEIGISLKRMNIN